MPSRDQWKGYLNKVEADQAEEKARQAAEEAAALEEFKQRRLQRVADEDDGGDT